MTDEKVFESTEQNNPFTTALLLVKLDQLLQQLEKGAQRLTSEIEQCDATCESGRAQLNDAQTTVHNVRKQLAQHELEDKALQERERSLRKKLDVAASAKEYQALTKELEELQTTKKNNDEKVFVLWNELETAQNYLKQTETQAQQVCSTAEQKKQELHAQREQVQAQLVQEQGKRDHYCASVDPEWLQKYETMRKSVPNPVVPVINGTCSACSFDIVHADLMQLERHLFLPCRGCYRLLYIE